MTEHNRGRVAAMFAAYTELDIGASPPSALYSDFNQVTHTVLVECHKGIFFDNACCDIIRQETACIITGETEGGLC